MKSVIDKQEAYFSIVRKISRPPEQIAMCVFLNPFAPSNVLYSDDVNYDYQLFPPSFAELPEMGLAMHKVRSF